MEIKINDKQLKQIIMGYILGQAVAEGKFNLAEASDLKTIERILDKCGDGRFSADEDENLQATKESIAALKESGLPVDAADMFLKMNGYKGVDRKNNFKYIYDPKTRSWIDNEEIR
jgi:hypothetical protein